jgi:transglutaminase-like putative cysteine protease
MRYRITHTTKYAYSNPVPVCHNKIHLRPRNLPGQTCQRFRLIVIPDPSSIESQLDYFGNTVDYFSLSDSHRGLSITATSEVNVTQIDVTQVSGARLSDSGPAWENVAGDLRSRPPKADIDDCLFAFASDYAASSPDLADYTSKSFTPGRPIVEAALDLMERIHNDFEYKPHSTNVHTLVAEVFANRAGVCQDFAHLGIACLRSMGLAARYVSGYLRTLPPPGKPRLVGADESHAWLSAYCGRLGWVDLDPTNNIVPAGDHVTVAYGRDYGDVCPIQGVYVGGGDQSMTVSVDMSPML